MDGVIADFARGFTEGFQKKFPNHEIIKLEDIKSFSRVDEYHEKFGIDKEQLKDIYRAKGFFLGLKMIPGAKEALNDMVREGFKVFICTAPSEAYKYCVSEKYTWTEQNLGPEWIDKMILTKDKTLVKGHILIDDNPHITGVIKDPEWQHVLFDQPYNRHLIKDRLVDWSKWRTVCE